MNCIEVLRRRHRRPRQQGRSNVPIASVPIASVPIASVPIASVPGVAVLGVAVLGVAVLGLAAPGIATGAAGARRPAPAATRASSRSVTGRVDGPIGAAKRRAKSSPGRIVAVGAENQYANVIAQIGGRYVAATAIESNPNTDPHDFEASPHVAQLVQSARLVVQNGLGYDTYMNKIEQASPSSKRFVVDVQTLLGLPNSTRNPHLWYQPSTMPKVAAAIARDLASIEPAHRQAFDANLRAFDASLEPWYRAIDRLRSQDRGAKAATTEPVGDYLLDAAGITISTPWALQADIMNGVDPAPQAVTVEDQLLSRHEVKVFVYNEQVTDSVTASFLALARRSGVPVVGVYERMPTPGYDYQSWMLAETTALERALAHKTSTARL